MATIPTRRKSNPFLIGLFVLIGLSILATAVIWLGVSSFFTDYTKYVTYFDGSVEGLEPGSPVKYQGVPIGNVKTIGLAPDGKLIEVVFEIESKTDINDRIRVKAEIAGIAGGKFLQLFYPESEKASSLYPQINFKPPYPIILSTESGIEKIEIALTDIVNNIRAVDLEGMSVEATSLLRSVSSFFNDPKMQAILRNFEKSSYTANEILGQIENARYLENINLATDNAVQTTRMLEEAMAELRNEVDSLQRVNIPYKIETVFARYDTLSRTAGNLINTLGYRVDNTMFSVGEAVEQFKSTNKQLQKTLRKISDNPSQSILVEPAPPEK